MIWERVRFRARKMVWLGFRVEVGVRKRLGLGNG